MRPHGFISSNAESAPCGLDVQNDNIISAPERLVRGRLTRAGGVGFSRFPSLAGDEGESHWQSPDARSENSSQFLLLSFSICAALRAKSLDGRGVRAAHG